MAIITHSKLKTINSVIFESLLYWRLPKSPGQKQYKTMIPYPDLSIELVGELKNNQISAP